jgi:hypothetical protein
VYTSGDASNLLCTELQNEDLCVESLRASNCAQGSAGLVCSLCAPGYANQAGFCKPCSDSDKITNWATAGQITAVVLGTCSFILLIVLLIWYPLLSSDLQDVLKTTIERVLSTPSHVLKSFTRKLSLLTLKRQEEKRQRQQNCERLFAAMGRHYGGLFVCIMMIVGDLQVVGSFKDSMAIPWPKAYTTFGAAFRAASIQPFTLPRCDFMHQPAVLTSSDSQPLALLHQSRLHCS